MDLNDGDRSLIEKARAGDREAMNELARRFGGRLEEWIRSRLGEKLMQKVSAGDLVQDTFIQAFRSIERFRTGDLESFWTWLRAIARNAILKQAAHEGARKRGGGAEILRLQDPLSREESAATLEDLLPGLGTSPSERMAREERFECLRQALDSLSPEHRQVILLARVKGLPMKEIAARMGKRVSTASMLLLRAQRKLKAAFGKLTSARSLDLPHDRSLEGEEESHE
jgi:RNA polymerase sigma-70 factor (ECF subfamily)